MDRTELIWMNGAFVPWEDAKVHVLTHGLHYGTGVFDSMRCYETELGPAVFRNAEHIERLLRSAERSRRSTCSALRNTAGPSSVS